MESSTKDYTEVFGLDYENYTFDISFNSSDIKISCINLQSEESFSVNQSLLEYFNIETIIKLFKKEKIEHFELYLTRTKNFDDKCEDQNNHLIIIVEMKNPYLKSFQEKIILEKNNKFSSENFLLKKLHLELKELRIDNLNLTDKVKELTCNLEEKDLKLISDIEKNQKKSFLYSLNKEITICEQKDYTFFEVDIEKESYYYIDFYFLIDHAPNKPGKIWFYCYLSVNGTNVNFFPANGFFIQLDTNYFVPQNYKKVEFIKAKSKLKIWTHMGVSYPWKGQNFILKIDEVDSKLFKNL